MYKSFLANFRYHFSHNIYSIVNSEQINAKIKVYLYVFFKHKLRIKARLDWIKLFTSFIYKYTYADDFE